MSYTIEELCPREPILEIDRQEIVLSLVTLQKEIIFSDIYGSLKKALELIETSPEKIIDVVWILVKEKSKFKTLEVFKNFLFSSSEPTVDWSKKMTSVLQQSVSRSMPLIKNAKRQKEIRDIQATQTESSPCYAEYFDTVAKRYGYDLEKFLCLTLRQLQIILKTIGEKSYDELEERAILAGRSLKPRIKFQDVSEEEEEENERSALEALEELKRKYEKNKGK